MQTSPIRSRLLLWVAIAFVTAASLYSCVWAYYIRMLPQGQIGVVLRPVARKQPRLELVSVAAGSPAQGAGLVPGDAILEINGVPLETADLFVNLVVLAKPNSRVVLTIERMPATRIQCVVTTPNLPPELLHPTVAQVVIMNSLVSYPFFFLAVMAVVLFYRYEDRNAWLLALVFTGFIALAPWTNSETELLISPAIRRLALPYQFIFRELLPALFYWFFAVFPVRSPIDRTIPWLKTALIGGVLLIELPFVWMIASTASYAPLFEVAEQIRPRLDPVGIPMAYSAGAFVLGLVSLGWNGLTAPQREARRKIRVMALGMTAAVVPLLAMIIYVYGSGKDPSPLNLPFYTWVIGVSCLMLVPISFAYAVVKHRVMEIPVLLKRSARYFLVRRGFAFAITAASFGAAWVFVKLFQFAPWIYPNSHTAAVTVGMAGAGIGGLVAVATSHLQERVRTRLDKAFFRGQYDARQLLEDLADRIRSVQDCDQLAALLETKIVEALQPSTVVVYVRRPDGYLQPTSDHALGDLSILPIDSPLSTELSRRGRPVDVPPQPSELFTSFSVLAPLHPDCIVPISARDGSLVGMVVLGVKRSEEPYSGEDKRLLRSVASQAGIAIDAIRLAEQMAKQLVEEKKAAYELEMARQVQARLLPQRAPAMQTLDYAGACIQARAVGGDYYDFLDLGKGRMALVLADVSGKGMPAALLMANLQASLRSHCAAGLDDLASTMRQVNQLLYESTAPQHFATLFLAEYSDARLHLRYVNCGHNPPILLRKNGVLERLQATACVLGAFPQWQCDVAEVDLTPGDLLAVFTDGVTEATNAAGEEFGEERLIAAIRSNANESAKGVLDGVRRMVEQFSGRDQADDLTLIVARMTAARQPISPESNVHPERKSQ
jgi:sigma-B regulation protein RsbU (phosphoserine phosphatase)